jgi:hypothetical protein
MPSYESLVVFHALFGAPALVTFWIAALARKGSTLHRRAGRVYLVTMLGIVVTTLPLMVVKAQQGRTVFVILLGYLFLVAATGMTLAWRAIREKRDLSRFASLGFRALAVTFVLYALVIVALSGMAPSAPSATFMVGVSSLGLWTGIDLWRLLRRPDARERWWLAQHLNGATLNFAATHASFLGLGLRRAIPALEGPWMNTTAQLSVVALALLLRWRLGRRFLEPRGRYVTVASGPSRSTLPMAGRATATGLLLALLGVLAANGAPLLVDSLGDEPETTGVGDGLCQSSAGTCTLRAALQEAESTPEEDVVTFTVTGTIAIGAPLPPLASSLRILGPGTLSLDLRFTGAATAPQLLLLGSPTPGQPQQVEIANLSIRGATGQALAARGAPGEDRLILRRVLLRDNGQAVFNHGDLEVVDSAFDHNGNFPDPPDGELFGGAIANRGSLNVTGSSFVFNSAASDGGALFNRGTATLRNSTFSANSATGSGGAIANLGTLRLNNVTVADNQGFAGTGGISNLDGPVELSNTILSGNGGNTGIPTTDCEGTVVSRGHNFAGTCVMSGDTSTDVVSPFPDAQLGPLDDLGGFAPVRVPEPASPAVDAGGNDSCEAFDQPGRFRPQDGDGDGAATCDIGAVEREAAGGVVTEVPALSTWGLGALAAALAALAARALRR